MKNFKLVLAYDGSRYRGWQRLGDSDNTIQGKLENVVSRMVNAPVEVIGSGRTDAGAHARGQVANFRCDTAMSPAEVQAYLRQYLPEDIGVLSVEEADARFHSRYNAVEKTYQYRVWNADAPCVFVRRFVWPVEGELDVPAIHQVYARCPVGGGVAYAVQNRLKKAAAFHIVDAEEEEPPLCKGRCPNGTEGL